MVFNSDINTLINENIRSGNKEVDGYITKLEDEVRKLQFRVLTARPITITHTGSVDTPTPGSTMNKIRPLKMSELEKIKRQRGY